MTKWSSVDGANFENHVTASLVDEIPPLSKIPLTTNPVYALPKYPYSPSNIVVDESDNVTLERG